MIKSHFYLHNYLILIKAYIQINQVIFKQTIKNGFVILFKKNTFQVVFLKI